MICSKCKKVIPNGSVQCPECGADLKSSIQKTKAKTGCMWAFIIAILAFAIISVALIISVTNDSSPDSSSNITTTAAQIISDKKENKIVT